MDRGAFSQGLREGAHHLDAMSVPGGGGSCSETEVPTVAEPTTPTELDETEPDDDCESKEEVSVEGPTGSSPADNQADSLLARLLQYDSQDTQREQERERERERELLLLKRERERELLHGSSRKRARCSATSASNHTLSLSELLDRRMNIEAQQLRDALAAAEDECSRSRLSAIRFCPAAALLDDDDEAVESTLLNVAACARDFYVGGTTSVAWRWMGGPTERGFMLGHKESYSSMAVVAVRLGTAGGTLERRCIIAARGRYPCAIANVANDSRGLSNKDANFIYIVWN